MNNFATPGPWYADGPNLGIYTESNPERIASVESVNSAVREANAHLIAAAPDMKAVLDDLEDAFDKMIYPEQFREDHNAPDDREYTVTITAKQWRALGRALGKAERGS